VFQTLQLCEAAKKWRHFWTGAACTLDLPIVDRHLLFSTGDPEIGPDLEGLTLLDDRMILLVNDNELGVEGAATRFWRVKLARPIEGT